MCGIVIYYLFPSLSRWNSSVIKLFVHPCICAHINKYFNYEDIIYIVCLLSARPLLDSAESGQSILKMAPVFFFHCLLGVFVPLISLNAAPFQRG